MRWVKASSFYPFLTKGRVFFTLHKKPHLFSLYLRVLSLWQLYVKKQGGIK